MPTGRVFSWLGRLGLQGCRRCDSLISEPKTVHRIRLDCRRFSGLVFSHRNLCEPLIRNRTIFWEQRGYCHSIGEGVDKKAPFMMKLDSEAFRAIFTPELNQLADIFKRHNYELRIAGGAVRDLLMGITPHDIDFATTATPEQMKAVFTEEQVRMLHTRGESHGTITCRLNDRENFEVTTLRVDLLCDGRHADVEFTTDWQLDSNRRDLTVNSMFLGLDGTIYDYFGGIRDVENRRIAFVGDAVTRIREDYLRILRYFRFYGRLAKSPDGHEAETLRAISDNAAGLDTIAGERLWTELKRIVVGRFGADMMQTMASCGVLPYLGFSAQANCAQFRHVYTATQDLHPQPMTLVPALMTSSEDMTAFHARMKLSNQERLLGQFILTHRDDVTGEKYRDPVGGVSDSVVETPKRPSPLQKHCQDLLLDETRKSRDNPALGRERVLELLLYSGELALRQILADWQLPVFPVDGYSLSQAGVAKGPGMATAMEHLYTLWKESDYQLDRQQLLERIVEHPSFPFKHEPPKKKVKRS